jgi:hypothetical protein
LVPRPAMCHNVQNNEGFTPGWGVRPRWGRQRVCQNGSCAVLRCDSRQALRRETNVQYPMPNGRESNRRGHRGKDEG